MPATTPPLIPQPFAEAGDRNTIPNTTASPGVASYAEGFPPITMQPKISGGLPPDGRDVNGILYALSAFAFYLQGGQPFKYDSSVSTAIGGYGIGAIVESTDGMTLWLNLVDANTTDPNASGAGWVSISSYGFSAISSLAGGTRTLTAVEARNDTIVLSGVLVSNQTIVLPTDLRSWRFINLTTGTFTTTVRTAGGVGVTAPQGGYAASVGVYGNGTDIYLEVPPVALPIDVAATPNTLAKRDNVGDLFARYFNSAASIESFTATSFMAQAAADGYLRKLAPADVAAQLSAAILANAALTGTPTAPTAGTGTNTNQVADTAYVQDNTLGGASQNYLGVSRALGVTYTNTTGRPISVLASIACPASGTARFQIRIYGFSIGNFGNGATGSIDIPASFIVPPGASYGIFAISGSPSLNSWVELR